MLLTAGAVWVCAVPAAAEDRDSAPLPATMTEGTVFRMLQDIDSQPPTGTTEDEIKQETEKRNWRKIDLADVYLERWTHGAQRSDVLIIKLAALSQLAVEDDSALDALLELSSSIARSQPPASLNAENAYYGIRAFELDAKRKKTPQEEVVAGLGMRYQAFLKEFPRSSRRLELHGKLMANRIEAGDLESAAQTLSRFGQEFGQDPSVAEAQRQLLFAAGVNKPFEAELVTTTGEALRTTDLRGNAIVMYFWSADAPRALGELPRLLKLFTQYYQHNVRFALVAIDKDRKKIDAAMAPFQTPFPQCVETKKLTINGLEVPIVTPTFLIVDSMGKLQASGINAEVERFTEQLSQRRPM